MFNIFDKIKKLKEANEKLMNENEKLIAKNIDLHSSLNLINTRLMLEKESNNKLIEEIKTLKFKYATILNKYVSCLEARAEIKDELIQIEEAK
jgi:predicted nuclease with TOPRIM domain